MTTIIAGSDGIATWTMGFDSAAGVLADDADAFGSAIPLAAGTTTGIARYTIASPLYFPGAANLVVAGTGGKIIDSGVIKATIYYVSTLPISS